MIVVIDDRNIVATSFIGCFAREGVAASGFSGSEIQLWMRTAPAHEIDAVEAFLIGACAERRALPPLIKRRSRGAVIVLADERSLQETLALFAAGADDVIGKPVHVREILARIHAIRARIEGAQDAVARLAGLTVYFDGRDPEIDGTSLALPRRERRILELLARSRGRLVSKAQIFDCVYGLADKVLDENVVESHISKLRKRLRERLGYDPIESQRFLGYRIAAHSREGDGIHPTRGMGRARAQHVMPAAGGEA